MIKIILLCILFGMSIQQDCWVERLESNAGRFIVDNKLMALYMFAKDPHPLAGSLSTCTGACLTVWPLYTVTTQTIPANCPQDFAALLGTIATGTAGVYQVTFNGYPLYYFYGDRAVDNVGGQGLNSFTNYWWVLSDTGVPVITFPTITPVLETLFSDDSDFLSWDSDSSSFSSSHEEDKHRHHRHESSSNW
jgi:predicted lipoprotein with Yx(FWY)xxD motif